MKRYFWLMFFLLITFAGCQKENVTVEGDIGNTGFVFSGLEFDATNFEIKTLSLSGEDFQVRAYEGIVYVKNPVVEDYQKMNIYVPENYFSGEEINGFSLETAPIFFPNKVGGYMPAKPETLGGSEEASYGDFLEAIKSSGEQPQGKNGDVGEKGFPGKGDGKGMMRGGFGGNKDSVSLYALKEGFVVASAGARGRSLQDGSGKYVGKAPAGIIDLKAAIRYLKYNDALIPGDSNKIISNGTSAGGAMSALLGSTANHPDYESYLEEIGAAPATDDIFAVSTYCPITNLDNADKAYEWEFKGVDSYNKISANQLDYNEDRSETESGAISNSENEIAKLLRDSFPFYLSTLGLVDTNGNIYSLNEDGEGNFKESIKMMLVESFNDALKSGENLSGFDWLSIENGEVVSIDFESYVKDYLTRNKGIPAFDGLSLEAGENNLFGDAAIDNRHFTNFSFEHSLVSGDIASNDIVKLMNPMNYIPDSQADVSKFRRIRHGAKDADTSLAIPFILSEALTQWRGANVDFKYPWNQGHGGDYDIPQLIAWMNSITH